MTDIENSAIPKNTQDLQHLIIPVRLNRGVFMHLSREVDRMAPVGHVLVEPIETRLGGFSARCSVTVQLKDDEVLNFIVDLQIDPAMQQISGVSVNKIGQAIDVKLLDVQWFMSVSAPRSVSVSAERHLMNGLAESSMEAKLQKFATDQVSQNGNIFAKHLSGIEVDQLLHRYAELEDMHRYARRRVHNLRISKNGRHAGDLARSNGFKTIADHIAVQMAHHKAALSRAVGPDIGRCIRFYQLAQQMLSREQFKQVNDAAKRTVEKNE